MVSPEALPRPWLRRILAWIGRRLRPLVDPNYEQSVARLADLARAAKHLERAIDDQQRRLTRVEEQTARSRGELGAFRDRQAEVRRTENARVLGALDGIGDRLRRQVSWAQRAHREGERLEGWRRQEALVLDRLGRLARSDEPIIVGPWTGEVGFELLYWIPFVRWVTRKFGLDPSRLVAVSRGGTSSWYGRLAGRYIDAFEFLTPDQFRTAVSAGSKQRRVRQLDLELLRRTRQRLGVSRVRLLHPALMYELFYPVWKGQASLQRLHAFTMHESFGPAARPAVFGRLPSSYVAARFYFSDCFPQTPENRELIVGTLRRLTEQNDVVLLNPGFRVDDHDDFSGSSLPGVLRIDDIMKPEDNLAVQTAVIQGASAFVGTYGGFAYLAPLCRVDAVGLFSVPSFFVQHLEVALQAFDCVNGGRLTVVDSAAAALISQAFGSGTAGSV